MAVEAGIALLFGQTPVMFERIPVFKTLDVSFAFYF
jgi:hypothetical protein